MSIDPDNVTFWSKFLHSSDGSDRLGVISTKNDWIISVFKGLIGLVSELSRRSDNMVDVLGVSELFLSEDFTGSLSFFNFVNIAVWAGYFDFFVLDCDLGRTVGGSLEPLLVLKP